MIFFLNIPGAGTQSVHDTLRAALQPASCLTVATPIELSHVPDDKLASYPLIISSVGFRLLRRLPQSVRTICFLRHPINRTITHYRMLASKEQAADNPGENLLTLGGRTLEEILRDPSDGVAGQSFANPQTYLLHSDSWFSSRQTVAHLPPAEILAQAKSNLDQIDFVGFTEDLDSDIRRMCAHFGWDLPRELPDAAAEEAMTDIPASLAELICERNELDLALYTHARERFAATSASSIGGVRS